MSYTARHTTTAPLRVAVVHAVKTFAIALAIVVVFLAYTALSAVTTPRLNGGGHTDPRCALTSLTDVQCADGFADNGTDH